MLNMHLPSSAPTRRPEAPGGAHSPWLWSPVPPLLSVASPAGEPLLLWLQPPSMVPTLLTPAVAGGGRFLVRRGPSPAQAGRGRGVTPWHTQVAVLLGRDCDCSELLVPARNRNEALDPASPLQIEPGFLNSCHCTNVRRPTSGFPSRTCGRLTLASTLARLIGGPSGLSAPSHAFAAPLAETPCPLPGICRASFPHSCEPFSVPPTEGAPNTVCV